MKKYLAKPVYAVHLPHANRAESSLGGADRLRVTMEASPGVP
jgi:hypothetical protein